MKNLYIVLLSCLLPSSLIAQNFEEITGTPFDGVLSSSIAFADVDNDNDQDVLITGFNGPEDISKLYTNDGDGNFEEVVETPFDGVSGSSIAFADVDNDNDQDILITGLINSANQRVSKLYTNDGSGIFEEVLDTPFMPVFWSSIAFTDIDSDGDQDALITGNSLNEPIAKLYTNDGDANFTEVPETPFEFVWYSSIAFADIDNDGDQDVLITGYNNSDNISKLYTNDGEGVFTEVLNTPFDGVSESSIAFADIDDDNDQDVLITGSTVVFPHEPITVLYTNDGNGNFTEVTDTPFDGVSRSSIVFTDIDNDNDQDVLITGANDSDQPIAKLYTNDGNGNFTEVIDTPFEGVWHGSISFADIDNDNDQDVLITGNNGGEPISKLYRNLSPVVGTNEINLFSKVSISPNPSNGLINIDLGSLNDVSLKVLNVNGHLIYSKENINSPIYQFELDAAPGIYILELSAKGEKQQFKLVKK